MQHFGTRDDLLRDISGRRLSSFERADGENNVWHNLTLEEKARGLCQPFYSAQVVPIPSLGPPA